MTAERLHSLVLTLSFSIWVVYGTLQGMGRWPAAVTFGLLASAGLLSLMAGKEIRIKLLDWVLLGYFVLAAVATFAVRSAAFPGYSSIVIWVLYAAVTGISIAVGAPFTLEYARESTPPELWSNPGFLRVNRIISMVWGLGFVLNIVLSTIALNSRYSPMLVGTLAPLLVMGACSIFTLRYTKISRARAQRAAEG
jgi:uncharacterized membrane protein